MIRLSVVTSESPKIISKTFACWPGSDTLQKTPGGMMRVGHVEVREVADLRELATVIADLTPAQALTLGVPRGVPLGGRLRIAPRKRLAEFPGAVSRTRENWCWDQGEGVLLLDYDPPKGSAAPFTAEELRAALIECAPALGECESLVSASASSWLYRASTGECVKGSGGWHTFVRVAQAADIPVIGQAIADRSWLAGYGRTEIAQGGAKLLRGLVDTAVWQPERLSFDAGAACAGDVVQQRPAPKHFAGRALTLADVALSEEEAEKVAAMKAQARGVTRSTRITKTSGKKTTGKKQSRLRDGIRERAQLNEKQQAGLLRALYHIPPDVTHDVRIRIGMALQNLVDGWEIYKNWLSHGQKWREKGEAKFRYEYEGLAVYDEVTLGSLFFVAKEFGYEPVKTHEKELSVKTDQNAENRFVEGQPLDEVREELKDKLWQFINRVKENEKKRRKSKEQPVAIPLEAFEITTGVGKTTLVKKLIEDFKAMGLNVTIAAKNIKAAEEYEKALAAYRRGRASVPVDDNMPDVWPAPYHCEKIADGDIQMLGKNEHMLTELCRGGHCEHGNAAMLLEAERTGREPSPMVVSFFKKFPKLVNTLPCQFFDYQKKMQRAQVRVVVAAGLSVQDLRVYVGTDEHGREITKPVDIVIVDEGIEWVHAQSVDLSEIRRIINELSGELLKVKMSDFGKKHGFAVRDVEDRRESLAELYAIYSSVPDLLAKACIDVPEGAYISANIDLRDIIARAKRWVEKWGNFWEKPVWKEYLNLEESPLRSAYEIVQGAAKGSLSIVEGRLNALYYHPATELVFGKIPCVILDATLDAYAQALLRARGGNIHREIATQHVDVYVDPRRFYGPGNKKDKKYPERLETLAQEALATRETFEKQRGGPMAIITWKALAIEMIVTQLGITREIWEETYNKETQWKHSIELRIGWYGWHDRGQDEWKNLHGILLFGQQPVPDSVRAARWECYRALCVQEGVPGAQDLPHWNNTWEKQAWVDIGDGQQLQKSRCRLPDHPAIRSFVLDDIASQRLQAIGRLRGVNLRGDGGRAFVGIVGGAPVTRLAEHGLQVTFARLTVGLTGDERRAGEHQEKVQAVEDAAVAVAARGETVTRAAVEKEQRRTGGGSAARHETYQELLDQTPYLAQYAATSGRNAAIVAALRKKLRTLAKAAADKIIFQIRVLAMGVSELSDVATSAIFQSPPAEYSDTVDLLRDVLANAPPG